MDYSSLIKKNQARWDNAIVDETPAVKAVAKRLNASKSTYQSISDKTGVPWFVIAVIHERESSQRWDRSLAQGDPWNKVSTHVPRGRGPFTSFQEAAIDALKNCPPYAARWTDWSAGGALTLLELYNGLGYDKRGIPSPYIWSGTNQYRSGKYVSDGVFDPNVVDKQLGCAAILYAMGISFEAVDNEPDDEDEPDADENTAINAPKAGPVPDGTKPATSSTTIWASLGTVATAIIGALNDWKIATVIVVAAIAGYIIWERQKKPDIKGLF